MSFVAASIDYLVWGWRVAQAQALSTPITDENRWMDVKNPWNYVPVPQRTATLAAVEAGLWPEDVPLADFPKEMRE